MGIQVGKAERESEMEAEFVLGNSVREEGKRGGMCPVLRAWGREKKLRLSWVIAWGRRAWAGDLQERPPYHMEGHSGEGSLRWTQMNLCRFLFTDKILLEYFQKNKGRNRPERLGNKIPSVQTRITKEPNWVNCSALANCQRRHRQGLWPNGNGKK